MVKNDFTQTAYLIQVKHPVGEIPYLAHSFEESDRDGIKEMSLIPMRKFFELGTKRVKSRINLELENDLQRIHGISAEAEISRVLDSELDLGICRSLFERYRELGEKLYLSSFSKWHSFIQKIFPSFIPKFHIGPKIDPEIVIGKIFSSSGYVLRKNRIKHPEFIVCDQRTFSVIADSRSFVFHENTTIENFASISLKGNIGSRISVFVNPYLKSGILLGTRSDENNPLVVIPHLERNDEVLTAANELTMIPEKIKMVTQKNGYS